MSGLTRFHAGKCLKKYTLLDGFLKDLVNSPVDMVYHLIIYRFFYIPGGARVARFHPSTVCGRFSMIP